MFMFTCLFDMAQNSHEKMSLGSNVVLFHFSKRCPSQVSHPVRVCVCSANGPTLFILFLSCAQSPVVFPILPVRRSDIQEAIRLQMIFPLHSEDGASLLSSWRVGVELTI